MNKDLAGALRETLRHHVTGAIERGEAEPVTEIPVPQMPPLSLTDAGRLADIIRGVEAKAKVGRLVGGEVVRGEIRAVHESAARPYFPGPGVDVRNCCLWVTLRMGMEVWWPIAELMPEVSTGEFVIGYEG
jgi:hypothetical protein